jgi:heterodisulfide reductase subunit C
MTITDLTSMTIPEKEKKEQIKKILSALEQDIPDFCFQCGKCTSGCEAMKLLELEPHKIMSMVKLGFVDELLNSDIIWTCITCYKCKERCPQRVAPVEVLYSLKNIGIASGKQVPGEYSNILQSVLVSGLIQAIKEVRTRDLKGVNREALGLPPVPVPVDPAKFQQVLMKAATQTLG